MRARSVTLIGVTATLALLTSGNTTPGAVARTPDKGPPPAARFLPNGPGGVDKSVDACVDFYSYACGNWVKQNPIPPEFSSYGRFEQLRQRNRYILREALESVAKNDPKRSPSDAKIGDYWASCMAETAIARKRWAPLKPDLDRVKALKDLRKLAPLLAYLHGGGFESSDDGGTREVLFGYASAQDFNDASRQVGMFDQGGLGLPERDFYLRDDSKSAELREQYRAHAEKLFLLVGDSAKAAAAEAKTVLEMETELARASMDIVKRRDPHNLNNRMTEAELAALMPSFSLATYLKEMGGPTPSHYVVTAPAFFRAVEQLLKARPLADWQTYLRFWVINPQAQYLSPAFEKEDFAFYGKALRGAKEIRPRWQRCLAWVDRDLGEAAGEAFVKRAFSGDAKARVQALVHGLERALAKDINELPWMSAATKQAAQVKLKGFVDKLGYPDTWRDYSSVAIQRKDFLGNVHAARRFEAHRDLHKIGKPVDRKEWTMTPGTVNAYYNPQMNTINFPAGILQPPFFDSSVDDAVNFGGIGMVIGHELTHGFDDQGRKFDSVGNLRDWWTAEDGKKFVARAQCVEQQYGQYSAAGDLKVNGQLTLGENTADLGGLRIAYMAMQEELKKRGPATVQDGFTAEQRFFLGFAGVWCSNFTPEAERLLVRSNPHAPPRYRVNGVVSQMPEFKQAFSCKAGQPMAPVNVCRVW